MNNNLIKKISTIEDLKNKYNKYINFLKNHNAKNILHTNNNLLCHLKGTMGILVGWNVEIYISTAGLFHSVYGTEVFKYSLIPKNLRGNVKNIIGEKAENITYLFGVMIRSHFLSQLGNNLDKFIINRFNNLIIKISNKEYNDLCYLYVANRLEQHSRWPENIKYLEYNSMKKMIYHINNLAWSDLKKEYNFN